MCEHLFKGYLHIIFPNYIILFKTLARIESRWLYFYWSALAAALEKKAEDARKEDLASVGSEGGTGPVDDLEGCEEVISKEELRKLDSQPNPFNFSERVSQTTRIVVKVRPKVKTTKANDS